MCRNYCALLLLATLCRSQTECQILPNPDVFLSSLFNTTVGDIVKIAEDFQFTDVDSKDVKFMIYKEENGSFKNVEDHAIDTLKPTKIFIHGWQSSSDDKYIQNLGKAYHKRGAYNFIIVDWEAVAKNDYLVASAGCKNIGKYVGQFIMNITDGNENLLKNVHLIGYSLGAQVSGFAAREVKNRTGAKVGRITALDAAAPLFEYPIKMPTTSRISLEDAAYVDGIHTNVGFLGFSAPFATADFYINNGGPIQPGCLNSNLIETLVCSHGRSLDVFQESVLKPKTLTATYCPDPVLYLTDVCNRNNKTVFGEDALPEVNGTYYLRTEPEPEAVTLFKKELTKFISSRIPNFNNAKET